MSFDRRGRSKNPSKLRNLPQYKGKTDEELEEIFAKKMAEEPAPVILSQGNLEKRIEEKLQKFSDDYDLTDLKVNDREILRALIQAIISLEDYEQYLYNIRGEGINPDNLMVIDKIQKTMSDLRKDISNFQNDLSITRKHRKSDQETSVIAHIQSLKDKAKKFLESRQAYIFCEKCNTLLMTTWSLYPESDNRISVTCQQKDKEGKPCGHVTTVNTKRLLENRQTNKKEIMPETML